MDVVEGLTEFILEEWRKKKPPAPVALGGPAAKFGFFARTEFNPPYTSLRAKRQFISEYEIKKMLGPGQKVLRAKKTAILSPLAMEWLEEKGIVIERY